MLVRTYTHFLNDTFILSLDGAILRLLLGRNSDVRDVTQRAKSLAPANRNKLKQKKKTKQDNKGL